MTKATMSGKLTKARRAFLEEITEAPKDFVSANAVVVTDCENFGWAEWKSLERYNVMAWHITEAGRAAISRKDNSDGK